MSSPTEIPLYRPGRTVDDALAEHGLQSAVKLSSNELPWGAGPEVAELLADAVRASDGLNRYPDFGAAALRDAAASHHGTSVGRVAVGCGSSSLVGQLARACAGPGDSVVVPETTFGLYAIAAAQVGADVVQVPMRSWTADADALAGACDERTRLLFLANPNNPTSTAIGWDELRELAAAVPSTCVLVVDGAYVDFADRARIGDDVSLVDEHPNVAVLRTFSKAHGLAALRVGYMVGQEHLVAAVDRQASPFHVNALGQLAAAASLRDRERLTRRAETIVAERERVAGELAARGWDLPRSEANFLWIPTADAPALAAAREARSVITRPLPGGVRVTTGTREENDRFLEALDAVAGAA